MSKNIKYSQNRYQEIENSFTDIDLYYKQTI